MEQKIIKLSLNDSVLTQKFYSFLGKPYSSDIEISLKNIPPQNTELGMSYEIIMFIFGAIGGKIVEYPSEKALDWLWGKLKDYKQSLYPKTRENSKCVIEIDGNKLEISFNDDISKEEFKKELLKLLQG